MLVLDFDSEGFNLDQMEYDFDFNLGFQLEFDLGGNPFLVVQCKLKVEAFTMLIVEALVMLKVEKLVMLKVEILVMLKAKLMESLTFAH